MKESDLNKIIRPFGPEINGQEITYLEKEKIESLKKKRNEELKRKRIAILFALERVLGFCEYHLNLPRATHQAGTLEAGMVFSLKSIQYLKSSEEKIDVPLKLFMPERYTYVVESLEKIDVTCVGDFIPFWRNIEEKAKLRRAWNIAVKGIAPPIFLGFLVPRNGSSLYTSSFY